MKDEALKLALEALEYWDVHGKLHQPTEEAITAIKTFIDMNNLYSIEQTIESPVQKRPQNCGTGHCSCIECVMEPALTAVGKWDGRSIVWTSNPFKFKRGEMIYVKESSNKKIEA